ncbi:MAG: FIST N-terminal domain-containing protein, partial [Bacteroidota bacterium]
MLVAASGHSEDIDTLEAFAEIREQCEPALRGKTPQAGLLFAAIDFEHQDLLDAIHEAWPGIQLIGCTTDGELSSCQGFKEDSISLLLLASDTIEFTTGLGREVSQGAEAACSRAVAEARAKTTLEPSVCIATPESLTRSGQQIVEALAK